MKPFQFSIATKDKNKLKSFYLATFGFTETGTWVKREIEMSGIKLYRRGVTIEIQETRETRII